jgi:hypothetical protein
MNWSDSLHPAAVQPGPRLRVPDEKGGFSDGTASSVEGASPREEHDSTPQPANGGDLSETCQNGSRPSVRTPVDCSAGSRKDLNSFLLSLYSIGTCAVLHEPLLLVEQLPLHQHDHINMNSSSSWATQQVGLPSL